MSSSSRPTRTAQINGVQLLAVASGVITARQIAVRIVDPVDHVVAMAVVALLGYAVANELGGKAAADAFVRGLIQ